VANQYSNDVTVIDGATNETTNIPVKMEPRAVVVNPVTNKAYVANNASDSVTVIDGATNSTTTLGVGNGPNAVAVNPVTNRVYVANYGNSNVTIIDEVPFNDTKVRVEIDALPNHTTYYPQPTLVGKGVNRWTPKPTTRIERVLQSLNTSQRPWALAAITSGARTDSVRWAWMWDTDSLIKGENLICAVALESDAAITKNLGFGTPFSGNLMVYPLYRINPPSGIEENSSFVSRSPSSLIRPIPNPFVSFAIVPGHSTDRFALFDISGRRVGTYRGDRIGEGLQAGVYFIRALEGEAKPVRVVKVR